MLDQPVDIDAMRSVRMLRRWMPVTTGYHGANLTVREAGRRALTPMALVVAAVFMTDVVFAVDSVPAVYGITDDPYIVFALAIILAFIGVKLVLHWAHTVWPAVPDVPTPLSLAVILLVLAGATGTSLLANRRDQRRAGVVTKEKANVR